MAMAPMYLDAVAYLRQNGRPIDAVSLNQAMQELGTNPAMRPSVIQDAGGNAAMLANMGALTDQLPITSTPLPQMADPLSRRLAMEKRAREMPAPSSSPEADAYFSQTPEDFDRAVYGTPYERPTFDQLSAAMEQGGGPGAGTPVPGMMRPVPKPTPPPSRPAMPSIDRPAMANPPMPQAKPAPIAPPAPTPAPAPDPAPAPVADEGGSYWGMIPAMLGAIGSVLGARHLGRIGGGGGDLTSGAGMRPRPTPQQATPPSSGMTTGGKMIPAPALPAPPKQLMLPPPAPALPAPKTAPPGQVPAAKVGAATETVPQPPKSTASELVDNMTGTQQGSAAAREAVAKAKAKPGTTQRASAAGGTTTAKIGKKGDQPQTEAPKSNQHKDNVAEISRLRTELRRKTNQGRTPKSEIARIKARIKELGG